MSNQTHFINGQWQAGNSSATLIKSENPATGETIWQGHAAQQTEVDTTVAAARSAFSSWAKTPLTKRIEVLKRYQDILKANQEELGKLISDETGKQLWEARTESAAMVGKIDGAIAAFEQRTGQAGH